MPRQQEEEEVGAETVPDYETIVGLRKSRIVDVVARHAEIDQEIKALEEERRELKQEGVKILIKAKVKSVLVGDRTVTRIDGMSSKLSKEKLLLNGVSIKVIEKSTVKTPWTSLKVTSKKEGGGGE